MEWIGAVGTVAAAIVGGVFIVIAAALRRENTAQHAANLARLEAIGDDVCEVRDDVKEVRGSQTRHLEWHAEKSERLPYA
jgi:hypothetical protein